MAQVVHEPRLGEIDDYIAYLLRRWSAIPYRAAEWDEWDEFSQLTFVVDWPICEDRLQMLRQWAAQGKLTPARCAQYEQLLTIVARHRPTLERLLAD